MGKVTAYNVNNLKRCHSILKLIAEVTETNYNDIKSPTRRREVVDARRMFCVLARKTLYMPFASIAKFIKRDHSSAIYYVKQHESLMKTDMMYKHFYDLCEYAVQEGKVEITEDDTVDYIDAIVTENKYLKTELDTLQKQLSKIHKVLEI